MASEHPLVIQIPLSAERIVSIEYPIDITAAELNLVKKALDLIPDAETDDAQRVRDAWRKNAPSDQHHLHNPPTQDE